MSEAASNIRFTPVDNPAFVHQLSEPIRYGDNEIGEIAIRKPTGRDLMHIGSPITSDPTSGRDASINFPVAFALVASLSGIPQKVLEQADPGDLVDLFWKVGTFFMQGWQHVLPAMMKLKDLSSEPDAPPAN